MRVLLLGSGAKDKAIAWWLSKSAFLSELYVAPGDVSVLDFATPLNDISPSSPEMVYEACIKHKIDMVFIGTESPLLTGVVDYLNERNIRTFGCPSSSLKLENDREFSRSFAKRHNIAIPESKLFEDAEELRKYLAEHKGERFVMKSNIMAPSKSLFISCDDDALIDFASELLQKSPVLLEEFIDGTPVTVTLLLDNDGYFALPFTSDYIYTSEGNSVSTGGMGAICPVFVGDVVSKAIRQDIIGSTFMGLKEENLSYKGVLTISIIVREGKPYVVDYHVRFNDPATQAMIPVIKNDLIDLLLAIEHNKLSTKKLELTGKSSVAVIVASANYPDNPVQGIKVEPVEPLLASNMLSELPMVFFGAVSGMTYDDLVTIGGRNFTVVGVGQNIKSANENAYRYIDHIKFEGSWYREDIGNKFFTREQK